VLRLAKIVASLLCLLSVVPCNAEDLADGNLAKCREPSRESSNNIRLLQLNRTASGKLFDGGGGIDTLTYTGPAVITLDGLLFRSLEIVNMQNGQFDTIMVLGEYIATTERGEVEIISDWFDSIVLDPFLTWTHDPEPGLQTIVHRAVSGEKTLVVRTASETHLVTPPDDMLTARRGPAGTFEDPTASVAGSPIVVPTSKQDAEAPRVLRYTTRGAALPDLSALIGPAERIFLDLENDQPNILKVDLSKLAQTPTTLAIAGDASDRIVLVQPWCWQSSHSKTKGWSALVSQTGSGPPVRLEAPEKLLQPARLQPFTVYFSPAGSLWHLSSGTEFPADLINLENGAPDILILRNDGHLQRDFPVLVQGDPDLDQVWIDATAGWQFQVSDRGTIARVPSEGGRQQIVALSPGIKAALLPAPAFIGDPRLLDLAAYPGMKNEPTKVSVISLTRGGNVRFSAVQLSMTNRLSLVNGAPNLLELDPEGLSLASSIKIEGDPGLDRIRAKGMPAPTRSADGILEWRIDRGKTTQTIKATGFTLETASD